jgi:hypothetical protein
MDLLLLLFLPAFIASALLYVLMTMGDAVVSAARDWLEGHQ